MASTQRPDSQENTVPLISSQINPMSYPLTAQDRQELTTKRGFTEETIERCQFGSVKNQDQLDALGFEADFAKLESAILIPVSGTQDEVAWQEQGV